MGHSRSHAARGKTALLYVVVGLLAACQSSPQYSTANKELMGEMQQVLTDSAAAGASSETEEVVEGRPPQEILQALVPGLSLENASSQKVEERFDFAVREPLDVREFFALLTEGTEYSVALHPGLTGNISSLNLKNVSIKEAMDEVSALYGYYITREGNIFRVEPGVMQTRIFMVDYLNVTRNGTSNMSVTGGNGLTGGSSGGNNGTNNNLLNQPGGLNNQNNQNGINPNATGTSSGGNSGGASVNTTSESDFWEGLEGIITSIIGTGNGPSAGTGLPGSLAAGNGEERAVIVSPQTGMVFVRAYPDELDKVAEFIEKSQSILQRQVVLEAKILEVELKEGFQSGIDLSVLGKVNTNNSIAADFEFLEGSVSSISSPLKLAYGSSDFDGVISLLETQGNVQVISSPRIATLNNQKAVFKVGDEQYFLTSASSTSFGAGDLQTTNQNTNLQPFFSGIALDVTPQISENGDIILHIHPLLNQVQEDIKLINGNELPLANSATRESDSIARARNGEVVVISGLMQTRAKGTEAGIPGARDIAVVGNAFEQRHTEVVKTELVILLRAIVDEGDNMRELIKDSNENFDDLRRRIDPYYR